jgi:hypothetical protein
MAHLACQRDALPIWVQSLASLSIMSMTRTSAQAEVGRWMKETRGNLRMSQKEFARHLHRSAPFITSSFVAKTELGERRLDVTEFVAISKALGTAPRKMFDRLMEYLE